jgi:hypothetical protein
VQHVGVIDANMNINYLDDVAIQIGKLICLDASMLTKARLAKGSEETDGTAQYRTHDIPVVDGRWLGSATC